MKFDNVIGLGALGFMVALGVAAYKVSDKVDARNMDTLIWVGGLVVIMLGAVIVAMVGILAYVRRREDMGGPSTRSQRAPQGYMLPPAYGPPPMLMAEPDDQGSFVVRDNHAMPTRQEDWR